MHFFANINTTNLKISHNHGGNTRLRENSTIILETVKPLRGLQKYKTIGKFENSLGHGGEYVTLLTGLIKKVTAYHLI